VATRLGLTPRSHSYQSVSSNTKDCADRTFNAGEYDLAWDGSDDAGRPAPRGVYFARIEYATKGAAINGRVVVLR